MAGTAATSLGGSVSQQAVSWNVLAYLLTLSFLLLQQIGTLYYLGIYSLPLLVLVCYDVIVLVLFLFNSSAEYAALKGGTCWVVYVWGLTIKLLLFFFVVFNSRLPSDGSSSSSSSSVSAAASLASSASAASSEAAAKSSSSSSTERVGGGELIAPGFLFRHPRGSVIEVSLLLLVAGSAVYALLVFRALEQLVGGVAAQLSTEGMLLTDCVAHVVLDFIDAAAAFYTYSTCPAAINEQTTWLRVLVGIVLALAVFLHAYSFPSASGPRMPLLLLQQQQHPPGASGGSFEAQQQQQQRRLDAAAAGAAAAGGGGGGGGDIFMTRKHAALVGICIVDVPLACLRLFTWAYYPTYEGFSPFLFKNICFIPIQCARIRHASLAARLKAKRQQKLELLSLMAAQEAFRTSATLAAAKQQQQMQAVAAAAAAAAATSSAAATGQQPSPAVVIGIPTGALDAAAAAAAQPALADDTAGSRKGDAELEEAAAAEKSERKRGLLRRCCWSCWRFCCCCCVSSSSSKAEKTAALAQQQQKKRSKRTREKEGRLIRRYRTAAAEEYEDADTPERDATSDENNETIEQEERALVRLAELCHRASSNMRRLPVSGFSFKRVLQRLYFSKLGGGRHGVASLLDGALRVSFWKEIRLAVPFMVTWVCQIAMVTILHYFRRETNRFPVQLFSIEALSPRLWSWNVIPVEVIICLIIVSGYFFALLCCWLLVAPLLDVCCTALFAALRLLSFFLLVLTFRDFGVLTTLFNLQTLVDDIDKYALFLFAVEPMVGVLYTLYPVLCVMLGRGYISYVVQPAKTSSSARGASSVFDTGAAGPGDGDFSQLEAQPRGDEAGVVSTVSLMVFLNCRYMLAPFSIHQLLIGTNMIKAVRLNDGLLRVHWRQLLVVLVLRCWCLLLYFKFPQSITYSRFPAKVNSVLAHYETPELRWYQRFSLASIIFLSHVFLMLAYMIISQVTRLLALRRIENKSIFRDVALIYTQIGEEKLNTLTLAIAAGGDRVSVETVALQQQQQPVRRTPQREAQDVVKKYYIHCSQTWPGDFIPNFF